MKWGQWTIRAYIAGLVVFFVTAMHMRMLLVPSACDDVDKYQNGQAPPYYDCAAFDRFVLSPIRIVFASIGSFVHENRDDITAWATIAVAAFTATLWVSTRRLGIVAREQAAIGHEQATIAQVQADIAGEMSRPYLVLIPSSSSGREWNHTAEYAQGIDFVVKNLGTGPALNLRTRKGIRPASNPAFDVLLKEDTELLGDVVEANKETGFLAVFPSFAKLSDDECVLVEEKTLYIVAAGIIDYESVSGRKCQTSFRWVYDPTSGEFRDYGEEKYNYRR